ncbi:MAG: outer membrane protein insertion porin family [Kiritimatiellia bacterium]|jgi:outer membrane protein insertion porin family
MKPFVVKPLVKLPIHLLLLCIVALSLLSFTARADTFRVDDIRIEGLQRVSAKTVFATLPIKVNTEVSTTQLQNAVRAIFKTGFFSDIDIARDGDVVIINVVERPVINRIGVTGNSIIDTEPLLEGLKSIGLVEGDIFKQSALETIKRELNAQYSSIGRYATQIQAVVQELQQNQVNIAVKIIEGKVATIKHVNIVGNKEFTEENLQFLFEIKKSGKWSWITGSDQYAQQKLSGDLERLKAYYFDNGFLEFETTSTQVSLSPDKEAVYITVNIFEGEAYQLGEVDLAGDLIIPKDEINKLIIVKQGDVFSQRALLASSAAISKRLGDEGYSYARVRGVPDLDKEGKTAKVTFFVDPGTINYVRRIVFKGNTTTQDGVLRREMRQLEGAPVSTEKLEQSRARLARLPLFTDVDMSTQDIPGRPDQVDVIFTVIEQPSGSINATLGFSQGDGITLGAGLQQSNWLGTGNTLGFQVSHSDVETQYSFNFLDPYFTQDGVSRGVNLFYKQRDLGELDIASYSTDRVGANLSFGYPISERSRISLGIGVENISVQVGTEAVQEISGSPRRRSGINPITVTDAAYQNFLSNNFSDTNGNGFSDEDDVSSGDAGASSVALLSSQEVDTPLGFLDQYGDDFTTVNVGLGWSDSSLNRGIFPTKGVSQKLDINVSTPGGDLEYYKLIYRAQFYSAISENLIMRFKSRFGYADSYGDIDTLPFFENFFAGGSSSVRGFENSSLGPKGTKAKSYIAAPYDDGFAYVLNAGGDELQTYTDPNDQTLGGNILFETGVEFIFPVPFTKNIKSLRTLFFIDAGNVFSDSCSSLQQNCSNIDFAKLSSAAGIGLQWLSPVGPLSIYFAKSIQEQPLDKTESFQFSLGKSF